VTLPEGMQIAPGAANGIAACSAAEVGFREEVDARCPDASKLGTATISSPALAQQLLGAVYLRTPTPGHQFGLWLVTDALGLHVKIPGEIEPDPTTGRLTATFKDLPQVPVEEIDLNIWGGPEAPLKNPDNCGIYATKFSFAPHSSDPAISGTSEMKLDEGCGKPFAPTLKGGVTEPLAGHYSPLVLDIARKDDEQGLRGFEVALPEGELAKLAGVPLCPDQAAATGNCPAGAKIGHLAVSAGPGPYPLWLPQPGRPEPSVFLSGPYRGAPYSIVSEVPAQAGPFDLGVVTVRSGIYLSPATAQATVKADPLPQVVDGVATAYRRLHVVIDRQRFTLNPTDCRETAIKGTAFSTGGAVARPTERFQVGGCRKLSFAPKLSLSLSGGTERGQYPAFEARLRARRADANLARASVSLPHSEFLAQEHIQTVCTRAQFAPSTGRPRFGRACWTSR
jgi:hypothetical protein